MNNNILEMMQSKQTNVFDFNFDTMMAPPLASMISMQDGWDIYELCRNIKYSSKLSYKLNCIDQIMKLRGFKKMLAGTNRVIYRSLEDNRYLLKVSFDKVALSDNFGEFNNQHLLKPFVPKTFEVHPSGSIALQERVKPIRRMAEFIEIADDVFDIIVNNFIGKYVLSDIGCNYFMNWGVRVGYFPVLLDYPYCYELDGNKLLCNTILEDGSICNGVIDYDEGFNNLYCTKCGKKYHAKDLAKQIKNKSIIVESSVGLKVALKYGDDIIVNPSRSSDIIEKRKKKRNKSHKEFKVVIKNNEEE